MKMKMLGLLVLGSFLSTSALATSCVAYVRGQSGWTDFPQTPPDHEAYRWWDTAKTSGYSTGNTPQEGAVIVFKPWGSNVAGHVGIVARKVSGSEIRMDHANWAPTEPYQDGKEYTDVVVKDTSGGNWTSVSVYGSGSYAIYGFIYPKSTTPKPPAPQTGQTVTLRKIGNYGWYPQEASCINASAWYGLSDQGQIISVQNNSVCWAIEYAYGYTYHEVLFGPNATMCYQ